MGRSRLAGFIPHPPATQAVPAYIQALSPYGSAQMVSSLAPTNGIDTIAEATNGDWTNNDPGVEDLPAIITAWSGGAKGVGTKLFVNGGGHAASANNGIYVFDFAGTTAPTGWSVVGQSLTSAVREQATYTDGRAASTHTYDGMIRIGNLLYRIGGARWNAAGGLFVDCFKFDLGSNTWTQLADMPNTGMNNGAAICHDPVSNKLLRFHSGNIYYAFFNLSTEAWAGGTDFVDNIIGDDGTLVYDTTRQRVIGIGNDANQILTVNWSAHTVSDDTFTPSGDTTILGVTAPSAFYDPLLDRIWIFGGETAGPGYANIIEMHPSTFACTAHALSSNIGTPGFQSGYVGSYGRWCFMDEWRAIGLVTRTDAAPWVIRLPSS